MTQTWLSAPMSASPSRPRPAAGGRLWQSLGTAAALESVAVGGLLLWFSLHPANPQRPPVPLQIEAAAPEPQAPEAVPVTPSRPAPPPPPTRLQAAPKPAPTPPRAAPTPTAATAPPLSPEPSETLAAPNPATAAAPAPALAPPPPPPPPAGPVGPSVEYIAKVRAAVQAAFVYPAAAAAMDFHGRTRVGFTLRGVVPSSAKVLISSGMGLVDRAALQSVQVASYPPPPPELKGAETSFEVWVEFKP